MKGEAKKKLKLIRQNRNRTGSSPNNVELTTIEDRIVSICGVSVLDGDENLDELGFTPKKTQSKFPLDLLKVNNKINFHFLTKFFTRFE